MVVPSTLSTPPSVRFHPSRTYLGWLFTLSLFVDAKYLLKVLQGVQSKGFTIYSLSVQVRGSRSTSWPLPLFTMNTISERATEQQSDIPIRGYARRYDGCNRQSCSYAYEQ